MPRGKKFINHKGRSRHFTSPEELQQESEENSEEESSSNASADNAVDKGAGGSKASTSKKATNASRGNQKSQRKGARETSSEEESDDDGDGNKDDDDSGSDDDYDDRDAKKGVASLIEIENPNRVVKKTMRKMAHVSLDETNLKPDLTRREREQIEKQKARRKYEKLHAAGKTREAKSDLARLALIRQQREEAAAKREAEKKVQESQKT